VNEHVDLPGSSKIGLEPVPLGRIPFESDALPTLHRIADFHASVAKHPGIQDSVAHLKLGVAASDLDLQIAVEAAGASVPMGWNLQKHAAVENYIIRVLKLDMSVNLVYRLGVPTP
jgi:hypothetical protein